MFRLFNVSSILNHDIITCILMLIESTIIIIFWDVVIRLFIMACSSSFVGVTGTFGRWEENGEREIKSLVALHLARAVLTYSLGNHGEHEVNVLRGSVCLMRMCGMLPKCKASLHLPQLTCRVYLAFQLKITWSKWNGFSIPLASSDFFRY